MRRFVKPLHGCGQFRAEAIELGLVWSDHRASDVVRRHWKIDVIGSALRIVGRKPRAADADQLVDFGVEENVTDSLYLSQLDDDAGKTGGREFQSFLLRLERECVVLVRNLDARLLGSL